MSPWKVVMAPPHGTFQIRATSMQTEHPTPLAASDFVGTREADDVTFLVRYDDYDKHSCTIPLLLESEVKNAKMAKAGHMHFFIFVLTFFQIFGP